MNRAGRLADAHDSPEPVVVVLARGGSILVDAQDEALACEPGWFVGGNWYVMRYKAGKTEYLHRLIAGTPRGMHTDHADGNERNNTRANLRVCTPAQNAANRSINVDKAGMYKGVQRRAKNLWAAIIRMGGKPTTIGLFGSQEDAARAYDEAARAQYGEFACVNFPREGEQCAL